MIKFLIVITHILLDDLFLFFIPVKFKTKVLSLSKKIDKIVITVVVTAHRSTTVNMDSYFLPNFIEINYFLSISHLIIPY